MFLKYDKKSQWFEDDYPGSTMNLNGSNCVLIVHTTEGTDWPGYNGGRTAPTVTLKAPLRGVSVGEARQHFPFNKSARALQNKAGGVETNTLNAIQVELIGTCDPKHRKSWNGEGKKFAGKDYIYWPDASDGQLLYVAKFLADMHQQFDLLLKAPLKFRPYPASYGEYDDERMTFFEWNNSRGVYGHQHVPENSHGDPGDIDIDRIISYAKSLVDPKSIAIVRPDENNTFPNVVKACEYLERVLRAEAKYPNAGLEKATKAALESLKPYRT